MAITPITSWRKTVYVAKFLAQIQDDKLNPKKTYDTPIPYLLNVQPLSEDDRIEMFGANAKKMFRAMILDIDVDINEFDVAYLEGATPDDETVNGFNSNYIVRRVQRSNAAVTIYFESIKWK